MASSDFVMTIDDDEEEANLSVPPEELEDEDGEESIQVAIYQPLILLSTSMGE